MSPTGWTACWPTTVTVRLHTNDEDRQRKFNRAENVREIPPGDPDFETLYKRRNDAESINRYLDDMLWLRGRVSGPRRAPLFTLTGARTGARLCQR